MKAHYRRLLHVLISICLIKDFDSSIITNAEVTMMSVFLSQQRAGESAVLPDSVACCYHSCSVPRHSPSLSLVFIQPCPVPKGEMSPLLPAFLAMDSFSWLRAKLSQWSHKTTHRGRCVQPQKPRLVNKRTTKRQMHTSQVQRHPSVNHKDRAFFKTLRL